MRYDSVSWIGEEIWMPELGRVEQSWVESKPASFECNEAGQLCTGRIGFGTLSSIKESCELKVKSRRGIGEDGERSRKLCELPLLSLSYPRVSTRDACEEEGGAPSGSGSSE